MILTYTHIYMKYMIIIDLVFFCVHSLIFFFVKINHLIIAYFSDNW